MRQLDEHSAELYLRDSKTIDAGERVVVRELTGGVSNMVLLVERPDRPGEEFVLKQARPQLRTRQAWYAPVERIWREADVLRTCGELLAGAADGDVGLPASVPRIVLEDRENYLFAMSAAPQPHVVWKAELLTRRTAAKVARAAGRLLGTLHAASWGDTTLTKQLGDRTLFEQLRVEPYYRTLADARPEAASAVERLIASLEAHPEALVHADFSPKNLLLGEDSLLLVDFETGHYGDPAFDLGFFLSHLVLKAALHANHLEAGASDPGASSTARPGSQTPATEMLALTEHFRDAYDKVMLKRISPLELDDLWGRGVQNFAGCAWARLDGKSPVEYLTMEDRRERIRGLCHEVFAEDVANWQEVLTRFRRLFDIPA